MKNFPIPEDEVSRLKALRNLDILDSLSEERFDVISRVAQSLFNIETIDQSEVLQDLSIIIEHHAGDVPLNRALERSLELQRALKEREIYYKMVVQNIADSVIITDSKWVIQSMNSAAEKIFGYHSEECTGKNINIFFPNEEPTFMVNQLQSFIEVSCQKKGGGHFIAEISGGCLTSESETIYMWILRDVSEKKNATLQKGEFISSMAYELRTPMAAIQGALGLVIALEVPAQAKEALKRAYKSSEELICLVDKILEFDNSLAEIKCMKPEKIDIGLLLQEVVRANDSKITIINEPLGTFVYADRRYLTEVLKTLIASAPPQDTIRVHLEESNGKLKVLLVDREPEEEIPRTPSITEAIIEKLGGKLRCGQGAEFHVQLG